MNVVFYIAAAIAVLSTGMVITRLNAVHSLLYLIVSLMSISIIFYVLGAPFIAALEVIIYAGAIMVLFVFVIMMLNLGPETVKLEREWLRPRHWIGPGILTFILLGEFFYVLRGDETWTFSQVIVQPKDVSLALFDAHRYLLIVELSSMLLLAGLVGAYYLGRRDPFKKGEPKP
ncbi:MAG: NADH-quinone oxidoreductase subunit J [FCB group bacterium]|jgi:NADH-quinone oxidoreductase subunit J|nr:NADH-quinone oxidoreductase subunit J [FCB group bacterium]